MMLEVKNVCVSFGRIEIVKDVSFAVEPGDWLMLVGPNGAGKSTLLNAIAQLTPYTGSVYLGKTDIKSLKPAERACQMGLLRQDNPVGYHFTIEEIVELGLYARQRGWLSSESKARDKIEAALDQVGLFEMRAQSALTLSGGELQRAFLAQLFVQDPPLLLLDEPTSHLDLNYQIQTLELLDRWRQEKGRAIVSVVHDLSLAKRFGSHALLLNSGRCEGVGRMEDVLTDARLNAVYGLDVRAFMRDLLAEWRDAPQVEVDL